MRDKINKRYENYMNHIHDRAIAMRIENGVFNLVQDIADYLIKSGIKEDSQIIKDILNSHFYEYNHESINQYKPK